MAGEYIGKVITTTTEMVWKDGYYYITITSLQKRSKDLKEWEEADSKVTVYGKELEPTYNMALNSSTKTMEDCHYDLFSLKEKNVTT